MIEQKQLYLHKPETGQIGDCFRTSLACILNLTPEEVPHWYAEYWQDGKDIAGLVNDKAHEWLTVNHKCGYIEFPILADTNEDFFHWASCYVPKDTHFLVGCNSKNGGHCVVARSDGYLWDPAIDNSGMVGPMNTGHYWIGMIVKL